MTKLVVLDGFCLNPGDLSWDILSRMGELSVYERTSADDILARASDAEAVFVNKVKLDADILNQIPKLNYIGVTATGYNVIDVAYASVNNITVTNVPNYADMAVAQHVFAFLLTITNQVMPYATSVFSGDWSRQADFTYQVSQLNELSSKTFGIIGYGRIAKKVARMAKAFGMNVIAYTPRPKDDLEVTFMSLDKVFSDSDVISLHCPLNDETYGLVSERMISKMASNAILINTSRGELVDEKALYNALNENRIRAACLDVMAVEPPLKRNPLFDLPNCYITPHIAWAAFETRARLLTQVCSNYQAFLDGKPINVVSEA